MGPIIVAYDVPYVSLLLVHEWERNRIDPHLIACALLPEPVETVRIQPSRDELSSASASPLRISGTSPSEPRCSPDHWRCFPHAWLLSSDGGEPGRFGSRCRFSGAAQRPNIWSIAATTSFRIDRVLHRQAAHSVGRSADRDRRSPDTSCASRRSCFQLGAPGGRDLRAMTRADRAPKTWRLSAPGEVIPRYLMHQGSMTVLCRRSALRSLGRASATA